MAGKSTSSSSYGYVMMLMICVVFISDWRLRRCEAHGTFGFDIHHRYSDKVQEILSVDGLPEKGSVGYYATMAQRDRNLRGRHLATTNDQPPLTFYDGNQTIYVPSLGFLHYAYVSVGTPKLSYLVALDTGSDLFWLPCECTKCINGLNTTSGRVIKLNIYSPSNSSTSQKVPCSSPLCAAAANCSSPTDTCPYQVQYLSNDTSSNGYLVEDMLHLITDDAANDSVDAKITLGCGKVQTGSFLDGGALNGLFGLGMEDISVPSILASQGIISNSFSMCFGNDGTGRIQFGDNGTLDQSETPFGVNPRFQSYFIQITQIIVKGNASNVDVVAIFDSGTSFTYLNDPAYSTITKKFDSLINETRFSTANSNLPFEYCYGPKKNSESFSYPRLNLTMRGGGNYEVMEPLIVASVSDSEYIVCLGVIKSPNINLIGQNFMTGYRLIFDREKMVLGWKESDCYGDTNSSTPTTPSKSPPTASPPPRSPRSPPSQAPPADSPPATAVNPNETASGNNTLPRAPPPRNNGAQFKPVGYAIMILLFQILAIV